jgi:hypothetical protein
MDQTVLLFTGHLLDKIDRIAARFPYRLITEVGRMIQSEMAQLTDQERSQVAISSLAAGGDIIFAMEAVRRKIPLHVFLPFETDKFLMDSVKYLKDDPFEDPAEWENKFHAILSFAASVTITHPNGPGEDAFTCCNKAMLAFALDHANHRPGKILAIALIQHQSEVKAGGAAEFVNLIESAGIQVKRIWPARSNKLFR